MIPGGTISGRSAIIAAMSIDARGPRFGATLTTVVLAVVLITGSGWLLAVQALFFAVGAAAGVQNSPYGWLYRTLVRPRLGPPTETEDPAPPRFAQVVGLAVTAIGVVAALAGVDLAVEVAGTLAFVAAFLNAAFGLCLGCELYLLIARLRGRGPATA